MSSLLYLYVCGNAGKLPAKIIDKLGAMLLSVTGADVTSTLIQTDPSKDQSAIIV